MKKKFLALLMATAMVSTIFTACGEDKEEKKDPEKIEDVSIMMWGAEEDQTMLREMADAFIAAHKDEVNLTIELGVQSESQTKDTVLTDIEAAADVYAFADDQLGALVKAGALQKIAYKADETIEANGGAEAGSVLAATSDGSLYAYPMTADNGYFLFYDKSVFTEDDVKTFDGLMAAAAKAGKKVTMELNSGWYLYSFFAGAGLTISLDDSGNNVCKWNDTTSKYTGVMVTEAILNIAKNDGFVALEDAAFVTGIKDGSIAAGINGTWNAAAAQEAWGDNYAACKLPTYTINGDQLQMSSFAGYKLVGVNAYTSSPKWSLMLAEYITNYDNQVKRFETRGLGPSNVKAAESDKVKSNPAISALAAQSQYATVQRVNDNFWTPTETFGSILETGNSEGTELQTLLDNMVAGINADINA